MIKSTKQTSEEYISSISCTSKSRTLTSIGEETRRRSDNYKPFRKYDLSSPITKASENYETLDYKLQSSESKTNSKSKVFDFMDTPDFKNPMRDSSICKDAYQSTSSHFTSTSWFKNVNEESFSHDIKLKSSLRRNISILHNKEFKVQTKFNHDAGLNSMIAAGKTSDQQNLILLYRVGNRREKWWRRTARCWWHPKFEECTW